MLLIIGAMEEELSRVLKQSSYLRVRDALGWEYHAPNKKYCIVVSQIGLVNASLSLSHWLTKYPQIDQILVLGTAGAVTPRLEIGAECWIRQAVYGNADARVFGYQYGQIPRMPSSYTLKKLEPKLGIGLKLQEANIASSDVFIHDKHQGQLLTEKLDGEYDLVDMESAAFCQVAFRFEKPISIIKIVSDSLYKSVNSKKTFEEFLPQIALRLSVLLSTFLENNNLLN